LRKEEHENAREEVFGHAASSRGAEKEEVYEKCSHRNTRGGRDQTKPKINVLHLLGQFAPSVGYRTGYTSNSGGRFVPRASAR
jgi:hypothetical protein